MGTFMFWQRWLFVAALLVVIFGLLIALLSGTALFDTVFNHQINPAFWDSKTVDGPTQEFQRWIYGALGATVAGWGVFLAFMAHYPFKRRERWARDCIAAGLGLWFVVDTGFSLYHQVYFNAFVVNLPLLIIIALPLWFTRREFEA
jgi:hypothetical protein